MDNNTMQAVLWIGSAVILFLYLARRRKRKIMR
jgi:LPXTG-motif cell wall-anchored protein